MLREASVIGNEVQVSLLADMAGREPAGLEAVIERLRDFLVPVRPGTVRFSHALMHDAAYAALPFRLRRRLHARAGSALERRGGEGLEGLLAIHYGAARRWAETWQYGRLAGERAMERAAPVEATGFLRSAVEAARWLRPRVSSDELARVTARLGEAAELAGSYEEARKAYARARVLVRGDKVAEAELFLREGRLREGAGTLPQALRYYSRGIKVLGGARSHDARVARARLVLARGATRLRGGHHRKALPHLEQAVREAEKADDQATLGHAYYLLEWAHSDLGNPEAGRYRDLSLPIFEALGDFDKQGRVLTNLGVTAYHEGRWTEAVELYGRATEAADKAGDAVGTAFNINNLAEIRLEQGHVDESERLLREALATWRAAGFGAGVGTVLRNLGRVEMRRGKLDLAAELFRARTRNAYGHRSRGPGLRARRIRGKAAHPDRRSRSGQAPRGGDPAARPQDRGDPGAAGLPCAGLRCRLGPGGPPRGGRRAPTRQRRARALGGGGLRRGSGTGCARDRSRIAGPEARACGQKRKPCSSGSTSSPRLRPG